MIVGTGVHELIRINTILIIVGALIIFIVGQVRAVTCEECREIEKNRQQIQEDVNSKEKDLNTAFEKKEFKKVREIRLSITELRKKIIELRSKDEECRNACRPDVVKAAECSKIREEIIKLEDASKPMKSRQKNPKTSLKQNPRKSPKQNPRRSRSKNPRLRSQRLMGFIATSSAATKS